MFSENTPLKRIKFSIVVPTYNRASYLDRLIKSIFSQDFDQSEVEIIVVNDGSTDNTADILKKYKSPGLRSLTIPNSGPSVARNRGAEEAVGELIFFTDDDCILPPDLLNNYNRVFMDQELSAAGGGVENKLDSKLSRTYDDLLNYLLVKYNRNDCVQFLMTNNLCCKRDIFTKHKGFDERFTIGSEDREFVTRLHSMGESVRCIPGIKVNHYHHFTLRSLLRHHFRFGQGSYLFYKIIRKEKNYDLINISLRDYFAIFSCVPLNVGFVERLTRQAVIVFSQLLFFFGYFYSALFKIDNLKRT